MNTNDLSKSFQSLLHPPTFNLPKITPISHWLSGDAAFVALKQAVDELVACAPKDHDVLIQAFNISVREIRYIESHTFLLKCGGNVVGSGLYLAIENFFFINLLKV